MERIAGRCALITGGASGIGLAIAHALSAEGALVTVTDYDEDRLARLAGQFQCLAHDVRDRAGWAAVKAAAEAAHGPVDILCNNAGIGPNLGDLADSDPAQFDRMIAIKLTGAFNGVHTFAAAMRARGEGHIVNTASMAAFETIPGLGAYTAAKCGVLGLSEVLRRELAPHGVGVSVLCPGMVSTGLRETTGKADGRHDPDAPQQAMAGIDPALVADRVIAGIKGNWPYIFTHGERAAAVEARLETVRAAFAATPHLHEL